VRLFTPTFTNAIILHSELADPLVWDRIFYSGEQTLYSVLELSLDSEIIKIRQAHVHYNLRDYSAALATLSNLDAAPAQGLRLLCCAALEINEQVLEAVIPRPRLPLELENAVYAHFAKSLAYSSQEKYQEALEQLTFAEDYAATLGLANRLGFIRLERERLNMWMGRPNPRAIEEARWVVLNPKARSWSNQLLSSANLYAGRYKHVFTFDSDPTDVALARAFLGEKPEMSEKTVPLALAFHRLWQGDYHTEKVEADDIEKGYARVVNSLNLYHLGNYSLALNSLGDLPTPPDARFWWILLKFGLAIRLRYSFFDWSILREALNDLKQYRYVMAFAVAHFPYELFLASHYFTHPALVAARLELPTLREHQFKHVHFKSTVAPQTAKALQEDARRGETMFRYQSLHRMERKRYQDLLKARGLRFKSVVIQGGLMRRLERLQLFMPSEVWSQLLQDLHP
jgi:hypothetical protein